MVLATVTMLFMGMTNIHAQEKESQTVIIRIFENPVSKSRMYVTPPNGETQIIQLDSPKLGNIDETFPKNDVILQSQINNWIKQDFHVDGMTSYLYGDAHIIMVILTKD
jgi:hypothetical protein